MEMVFTMSTMTVPTAPQTGLQVLQPITILTDVEILQKTPMTIMMACRIHTIRVVLVPWDGFLLHQPIMILMDVKIQLKIWMTITTVCSTVMTPVRKEI